MKNILSILFFISLNGYGQPTFFGVASNPADNGTNTANPTAVTPPASMVTGDLVVLYAYCRTSSATIAISADGGQAWNSFTSQSSANATLSANVFWCRYNGSWGANPSVSFGATTNNNVVMLVFRPITGTDSWTVDANNTGTFVDRAAASGYSIAGWTPANDNNVNLCVWNTDDDNTWTTGSGFPPWTTTGLSAQYRNTSGTDVSSSYAYATQSTKASLSSPFMSEATLGNDGGFTFSISFYEFVPPATTPKNHTLLGVGKK